MAVSQQRQRIARKRKKREVSEPARAQGAGDEASGQSDEKKASRKKAKVEHVAAAPPEVFSKSGRLVRGSARYTD
jgi:hypothetical protein